MIAKLGYFSLVLALLLATAQSVLPFAQTWRVSVRWHSIAKASAIAQFLLVSLAFACLVHAFVVNDFSIAYVAANSNALLPVFYRVAGVWGGHEGSLLLWIQILSTWILAVAVLSRSLPDAVVVRVLGVLAWVSVGFLSFMLFTSNPFVELSAVPLDGRDLNPLLQDFAMIIHPPVLYMGYVGFSVAFAFAVAALLGGRLDVDWVRWTRPWTLAAWVFLTLGIFLGSFWAYYELGWGGWWFWDAVENASFMPWLVGTALIHSLAVTEKRGSFKSWTVLLAILAFSLSLLGTFLVRSGVLTSVHAFASDPKRGLFILVFLAIVVGGSLMLYAWRAPKLGQDLGEGGVYSWLSRETLLLVNNVFLLSAAATVLLGTLYPLFLDALAIGKISVGPPYFETVFVPLMIPVLLLLGVAPFVSWKHADASKLVKRMRASGVFAITTGAGYVAFSGGSPMAALGVLLAAWIVVSTVLHVAQTIIAARSGTPLLRRLSGQSLGYWGMVVAHLGLGIFVVGVTLVKSKELAKDASLNFGDTVALGDYLFTLSDIKKVQGPNYIAARATLFVARDGTAVAELHPEKRLYVVQKTMMTEAAIDRGVTRDLYVSLGEANKDGSWSLRLQIKPFVAWIWGGCLTMALGGLIAAVDRRYRALARKKVHVRDPAVSAAPSILSL